MTNQGKRTVSATNNMQGTQHIIERGHKPKLLFFAYQI